MIKASGSFVPHPQLIFKACHDEKQGFLDVIRLCNNGGTLTDTATATVKIPPLHAAVSRASNLNPYALRPLNR